MAQPLLWSQGEVSSTWNFGLGVEMKLNGYIAVFPPSSQFFLFSLDYLINLEDLLGGSSWGREHSPSPPFV